MDSTTNQAITNLAVAMHAEKGVYAVLLAAGVSIGAQMPTAWDIVLDLIRQQIEASGQPLKGSAAELEAWYEKEHGKTADYSDIVEAIAPTPASQRELLKTYFTPTDGDIRDGRKIPSAAHRALALLAKKGHVRVFLTTNFDDLMERALDEANVSYVTVTDEADLQSAAPLARGGVQIVKLHGDYRRGNVRNGLADLGAYPPALAEHLKRIIEDYGVIVAGWSAKWDHALRTALMSGLSRRYPMVWVEPYVVNDQAREVITYRQARVAQASADDFFPVLQRRVQALDESTYVAPLTTTLIEGETRQALRDLNGGRQRLIDLTNQLSERLDQAVRELPGYLERFEAHNLEAAEAAVLPMLTVIGTLTRHDPDGRYADVVQDALTRVSYSPPPIDPYNDSGTALRHLPAALTLYSTALAAVASRNFHYLHALLQVRYFPAHDRPHDPTESFVSLTTVTAQSDVKRLYPSSSPLVWVNASEYLRDAANRIMQRFTNPRMIQMDIDVAELVIAYAVQAALKRGERTYMQGEMWRGLYHNNVRGQPYIDHLKRVFEGDMVMAHLLDVEGVSLLDGLIFTARRGNQGLGDIAADSLVGELTQRVKGRL